MTDSAPQISDLLSQPRIVGAIASPLTLSRVGELDLATVCDIAEFRIDAFPHDAVAIESALSACPVPVLLTVRDPAEGGLNGLGAVTRQVFYDRFQESATLIDIELRNIEIFSGVVEEVIDRGGGVIASYHDFKSCPTLAQVKDMFSQAQEYGASALKLAVTPSSVEQIAQMAVWLEEVRELPVSLMAMGKYGLISRLLFGQVGSCLNYGFIDQATVPGQWAAGELKQLLGKLRS